MKRLSCIIIVGILLIAFTFAYSSNTHKNIGEKIRTQCYEWLVYGVQSEKNTIVLNSKIIHSGDFMAKSGVNQELAGGGAVLNWKISASSDAGDLLSFTVSFGPCFITVDSPVVSHGSPTTVTYKVTLTVPPMSHTEYSYTVDLPETGYVVASIPINWYPTGSSNLGMTHGTTPIGEKSATHAKECSISEAWVANNVPIYMYTDMAEFSWTAPTAADNYFAASCQVDPDSWPDMGKYAIWVEDISFAGKMVDFGDSYPVRDVSPSPESYHIWEEGVGSTVGWWGDNSGGNYILQSAVVNPPFRYNTTNLWIGMMDDVEVPDTLLIGCTGVRQIDEDTWTDEGDLVQTYGQWKSFDRQQQYGIHTKDDRPPELTKNVKFYIVRDSAIEHGISPGILQCDFRVTGAGVERANGDYSKWGTANGRNVYSNGSTYLWSDGEYWYISAGVGRPAWYVTLLEAVDPDDEEYFFCDWIDSIDEETGEWVLGIGPIPTVTDDPTFVADADGTISFKNDLDIPLLFWTVSATDRESSPIVNDILFVQHKPNLDIYGEALTHESWVGSGCSTPDVNGVFTVNQSNGYISLDIPNTYERRLSSEVQALVAAAGVPDAYWYRDYDHYYNQGTPPAEHEGVWDWRMWGYLQQGFEVLNDSPLPNVTCVITYKNDLQGMGDNHYTDSTRQTEFTYTPGDTYTLTRNVEIIYKEETTNLCGALFDLLTDNPLAIVTNIKLYFAEPGEYRLVEPALVLDPGDRNEVIASAPFYREAPAGHCEMKEFENWSYSDGGVSGHGDGVFDKSVYWPDSAKPNREEFTGGHLLVRYSKSTGGDFTIAFSAAQYASLMQHSSNALNVTYDTAAEDSHYTDEDDVALKTPACFDIVPFMHKNIDEGGGWDMCVIVGEATCVNGLQYNFYTKKYVGGQVHGSLYKDGETKRARSTGNVVTLLRKREDQETWEEIEQLGSDEHGHYTTESYPLIVSEPPIVFYDYEIKGKNKPAIELGQMATREFLAEKVNYKAKPIKMANARCKYAILIATDTNGIVELYRSINSGKLFEKTIEYSSTSPSMVRSQRLIMGTEDNIIALDDFGKESSEVIMATNIDGDYPVLFGEGMRIYMLYMNGSNLYCTVSNDSGKTFNTSGIVVDALAQEDQYATGLVMEDGSLLVGYHKSGSSDITFTMSMDGGQTWEEINAD